ncbi:hypothetical protein RF11_02765 [Thelohanellus kitauei]|uniref:Uncharacterized protein n=1 Tax=Thelohanellus kitauei TaxID=669202 RepID=A0A0C2MLV3_THEKT|nr:hypothetical protein RF11_02765 [Thelohanellus kitauei]
MAGKWFGYSCDCERCARPVSVLVQIFFGFWHDPAIHTALLYAISWNKISIHGHPSSTPAPLYFLHVIRVTNQCFGRCKSPYKTPHAELDPFKWGVDFNGLSRGKHSLCFRPNLKNLLGILQKICKWSLLNTLILVKRNMLKTPIFIKWTPNACLMSVIKFFTQNKECHISQATNLLSACNSFGSKASNQSNSPDGSHRLGNRTFVSIREDDPNIYQENTEKVENVKPFDVSTNGTYKNNVITISFCVGALAFLSLLSFISYWMNKPQGVSDPCWLNETNQSSGLNAVDAKI